MERVLLSSLGVPESPSKRLARAPPPMPLHELRDRLQYLVDNAIEKSSKLGYATAMRSYTHFCNTHSLPIDPTPSTLALFIAYTSTQHGSGAKYLTGVRHFLRHYFPDFDTNRQHPVVQAAIRGSKKVRADPVRRKQPLRIHHLASFLKTARDSKAYDDLLFITIVACGFYGCHRSGELVASNDKRLRDPRKTIKRASLTFRNARAQYHLPYHKADPFFKGSDVIFIKQDIANPVELLKEYVARRDGTHGSHPDLFICEDGSVPTRAWFDSKLFALVDRLNYGGHSLRSGGATFYASLGLPEDIIMALGRWSSQAWRIYVRENPAVRAEVLLATTAGQNIAAQQGRD